MRSHWVWPFLDFSDNHCSIHHLLTLYNQWRSEVCLPARWQHQRSLSSFSQPCVSFLYPCGEGKKEIATERLTLVMSQRRLRKTWTTDSLYLHKTEGAVGDKKQFLSLTDQSMQHSIGLLSSQNKLICEGGQLSVTKSGCNVVFICINVLAVCKKRKRTSYSDLPWPICTCSLWGEPCRLLPEDYIECFKSYTEATDKCYTTISCYFSREFSVKEIKLPIAKRNVCFLKISITVVWD